MKTIKFITAILLITILNSCSEDQGISNSSNNQWGTQHGGINNLEGGPEAMADVYQEQTENQFINVSDQAISTFSIDADGASYANVRRFLQQDNQLPPVGAIRTEELINYFDLDYEFSNSTHPISLNGEISHCPWNEQNKLIRIGIQGKPIPENQMPSSNFVFLIDVSGSMSSPDKLDLLKTGFKLFVDELDADDRVAIVTYAGAAELILDSTSGNDKTTIKDAIDRLGSGGGTAGAEGIITAYEIAVENFINNGNNRIVIGTDGDFNIGPVNRDDLVTLIEEKRKLGVYLTVLGVGRGNYNDASLEQIANNGNGTYEYIDNVEQLQKVFIHEFNKFYTVAKDVKVQVKFNAQNVHAYRLIGYENRILNTEDFEDDTKDAGEIGADQNITALYEIIPIINPEYRDVPTFTIDFRYKEPDSDSSIPLELEIFDEGNSFSESSDYMKFTCSVASFGMLLIDSDFKGTSTYDDVSSWLNTTNLNDEHLFKTELKELVQIAKGL